MRCFQLLYSVHAPAARSLCRQRLVFLHILLLALAVLSGCANRGTLIVKNPLPEIIRAHQAVVAYPGLKKRTDIVVQKGDIITVIGSGLVSFNWPNGTRDSLGPAGFHFLMMIDSESVYRGLPFDGGVSAKTFSAPASGRIIFDYVSWMNEWSQYAYGGFHLDIFVWAKEDYEAIYSYLQKLSPVGGAETVYEDALRQVQRLRSWQIARRDVTNEIHSAQSSLIALQTDMPTRLTDATHDRIKDLENKLKTLADKLAGLDKLRDELMSEKNRADLLSLQVNEIKQENKDLKEKLSQDNLLKKKLQDSLLASENALLQEKSLSANYLEQQRRLEDTLTQLSLTFRESERIDEENRALRILEQSLRAKLAKASEEKNSNQGLQDELEEVLNTKEELSHQMQTLVEQRNRLTEQTDTLRAEVQSTKTRLVDSQNIIDGLKQKERSLTSQIENLKEKLNEGMAPMIVIIKPQPEAVTQQPQMRLQAAVIDDSGIKEVNITLNGRRLDAQSGRGIVVEGVIEAQTKRLDIARTVPLKLGENTLIIEAVDGDGLRQQEIITVTRRNETGKIWGVVVGINDYSKVRDLRYATNDAYAFKKYLVETLAIPEQQLFYLTNSEATQENIRRVLGTTLKRKVSSEDTVIIFYAGHGAVETDPSNPDGDGMEKYLLPVDADMVDLFTSAISMNEVKTIFQRIQARRLIFIADTCYSGAAGGRSLLTTKYRASLSENFLERIAKSEGRVIITSCSANEISKEDDTLQHGVFSYHLIAGLKGKADSDGDGFITVNELFDYLSKVVPEASGQDQHPVKKGEITGEMIIGRVQ